MNANIVYAFNDYNMKRITRFRGPSLIVLALVHILVFAANLVVVAILRHGAPFVNPFADGETVRAFFAANPRSVQIGSFFLFGSAVPLGIYGATIYSRMRHLGIRATGTVIALLGGLGAAGTLVLSGSFGWVLSQPNVSASVPVTQALYFLSFLLGGAAYAMTFGLLVAGVTVTCYLSRLFPFWLAIFGILVALAGECASLSLVFPPANYLIPITRYLGFVWMVVAAVRLSREQDTAPATLQGG